MTFSQYASAFGIAVVVFFIVDLLWLGIIGRPIYNHFIGDFLASPPKWGAAITFYLLFIVGMLYFAIVPAINEGSLQLALQHGAAYGFFTYMTYELTNRAVIKGWPLGIVPIDIAWGTLLAFSVSGLTYVTYDRFVS